MSRDYTTRASERGERIRDVGRAENQSVAPETVGGTIEELRRDVQRLQTWHTNQRAMLAEKDETIQAQSERIADLVADVWQLEADVDRLTRQRENQERTIRVQAETIGRLEYTPQNPPICPIEPPVAQNGENVPAALENATDSPNIGEATPVPVHTSPQVRLRGGE